MRDVMEITSAVLAVNREIYERLKMDDVYLEYHTNGFAERVTFGDFPIWDSETDIRKYDETSDTYEPFLSCFRRRLTEVCATLAALKIQGEGT